MLQYAYHGTKTMFSIIIIALVQLKIDALIFPICVVLSTYIPSQNSYFFVFSTRKKDDL